MNQLQLFLPCAAGVEDYLAAEVAGITGQPLAQVGKWRAGVLLEASWRDAMALNLHSRLAQRVLLQLFHAPYRNEQDLYRAAGEVAWEIWFTPRRSIKVEVTAQHSPLTSLNFAALRIKDAVCDRFRATAGGIRPDVDTQWPDIRIYAHLTTDSVSLYIDTSGEALFKRGWREDKGEAPLKETLAAAMLFASGWAESAQLPLYDPCCGSGTIAIEAAQIACRIAPGALRHFAFEKMLPFQAHVWNALRDEAQRARRLPAPGVRPRIFGSDVAHRMVDFAERNARRAGVADVVEFRGGDALQRLPPCEAPGVMLVNPPYGTRIEPAGFAGAAARQQGARAQAGDAARRSGGREAAQVGEGGDGGEFFVQLAAHWKKHYAGWSAWVLTPDMKLPGTMRLKATRRVPLWNGPIECRMLRFDMVQGSARDARQGSGSGAVTPAADHGRPLVLDTNIVLDLLLFLDPPAQLLHPALATGSWVWIASLAMRDELVRVLDYRQLQRWLLLREMAPGDVLSQFDRLSNRVPSAPAVALRCSDPHDQIFVDLAASHRALLLSKDRALTRLRKRLAAVGVEVRSHFSCSTALRAIRDA